MIFCSTCPKLATVRIAADVHLCDRCAQVMDREFPNVRDNLPNPFAGLATAEAGNHPAVADQSPVAPVVPSSPGVVASAVAASPSTAAADADINIPDFLKRSRDNIAPWMRAA